MVQEALVLKTFPDNTAEISVKRQSACGGNCSGCDGCLFRDSEISVIADNCVAASVGQRVLVETRSRQVFVYAILIYIIPVLLLITGYLASYFAGLSDAMCVLIGFCLLIAGTAVIIFTHKNRKNEPVTYSISSVLEDKR